MNNYDLLYNKIDNLKPNECILSLLNKNDVFTINQEKFKNIDFCYEREDENGLIIAHEAIFNNFPKERYNLLSSIVVNTDVARKRIDTFKTEYIFRKNYFKKLEVIFDENLFEDINKLLEYLYTNDIYLTDLVTDCKNKCISFRTKIEMTKNPNIIFNITDIQNSKIKNSFNMINNKGRDFKYPLNKDLQFRIQHSMEDVFSFRKLQ